MGISIWHLVVVALVVLLVFGSGRLRNLGGDLGGAIRGFRSAMSESQTTATSKHDA